MVFVNTSFTSPVPLASGSAIPATAALDQLKVELGVALSAVYANVAPLQIADGVRVLLNNGNGLTVRVTLDTDGRHVPLLIVHVNV